jgi:S-adenosylmethionine/arginine decarboxylase-like enzyme
MEVVRNAILIDQRLRRKFIELTLHQFAERRHHRTAVLSQSHLCIHTWPQRALSPSTCSYAAR